MNIGNLVEFVLLSFLFYKTTESKNLKKVVLFVTVLFGGYLLYSILTSKNDVFDSVSLGIRSLILLVYSIFFLFERIKDPNPLNLFSSPVFWVVVAIMIYSAGTFFPFIYANSYMRENNFDEQYAIIHDPVYIIKNLIFSFAMLQKDKPVKSHYPAYKKIKPKP
ncbi:MAG: hypothetical protein QM802_10775 [Agriterribacter sp.]